MTESSLYMSATQIPFLRQLSAEDADALVGHAHRRKFAKSDLLLRAGAAGDDVAVVLSGRVRLVAYGVDDREVMLAIRGPGELIGDMAALGGHRRTATAVAVDAVEAGFLRADEFATYLHDHPAAALVLLRTLVRRLAEADRDRVDLATQDSVGRVAKRLLDFSSAHGTLSPDGVSVEIAMTQDELARWTGATRETVSRALRLMRQLGWVTTGNRTITVLDPEALRKRCGG
jgi:CRP/FNR family transcriptional regulator, cyclic AMP receptor protein